VAITRDESKEQGNECKIEDGVKESVVSAGEEIRGVTEVTKVKGKAKVLGSSSPEVSTGEIVVKAGKRKYVKRDTNYWESRAKKGKGATK
jgi:hypothetical protein